MIPRSWGLGNRQWNSRPRAHHDSLLRVKRGYRQQLPGPNLPDRNHFAPAPEYWKRNYRRTESSIFFVHSHSQRQEMLIISPYISAKRTGPGIDDHIHGRRHGQLVWESLVDTQTKPYGRMVMACKTSCDRNSESETVNLIHWNNYQCIRGYCYKVHLKLCFL